MKTLLVLWVGLCWNRRPMKKTAFSLLLFTVLAGVTPTGVSAAPKPTPSPTPAASPAAAPVDATGWTTPRPPYPDAARKGKFSGSVRLRVVTDRRGKIKKATVLESSGHKELDDATVQFALANWTGPKFSQAVYVQNYTYKK